MSFDLCPAVDYVMGSRCALWVGHEGRHRNSAGAFDMPNDGEIAKLRARCHDLERRLELLSMWAGKLGLPNSLAGNAVRSLLDLRKPLRGER